MRICSAVLASGESKRFGKNKLKEKIGGRTFLEIVVDVARRYGEVFVVSKEIMEIGAEVLINDKYKTGISSSVSIALKEAIRRRCDWLLVFLGDMPFIEDECVNKVLENATDKDKLIIFPYSDEYGKGFPTLVRREAFVFWKDLKGDEGLKQIIRKYPHIVSRVYVDNPKCFTDIDTPGDLKAL